MKSVSPELLEKLKSANRIVDLVGEHVVLKKSGSNYTGLCPFHGERTPSFSVSETKQLYHCYGCKAGGDMISFLMEINGISFQEALEELSVRSGIPLPDQSPGAASSQGRANHQAFKLNRFVAAFFRRNLESRSEAREYLSGRGILEATSNQFYVGYAPSEWSGLSSFLIEKKAPVDLALKMGLIRTSKKDGGAVPYFDLFRHRVMFPILNPRGKVCGFGGRILPGARGDDPKYFNSPDSMVYQKSKILFGLYQARKHIRERDQSVLVEGFFDVLAMHQMGIQQTVATCGTSLTKEHIRNLKRFSERIILLFDGDSAGQEATERAMELGLEEGVVLYGVSLPDGRDPADFLKFDDQPGERMKQLLDLAKPILDEKIDHLLARSFSDSEEQSSAVKKIRVWLEKLADPIGKAVRAEVLSKKMGISQETLLPGSSQSRSRRPPGSSVTRRPPTPAHREVLPQADRALFSVLAHAPELGDLLEGVRKRLPKNSEFSDLFEHPWSKKVAAALFQKWRETPDFWKSFQADPLRFLGISRSEERGLPLVRTLSEVFMAPTHDTTPGEYDRIVNRQLLKKWAWFSQEIEYALESAEVAGNRSEQERLMQEYLDVQRKLKEFGSFYVKT